MRAIFISYRRDDTEGQAGRLFQDLSDTFGSETVFMDVSGIEPGIDSDMQLLIKALQPHVQRAVPAQTEGAHRSAAAPEAPLYPASPPAPQSSPQRGRKWSAPLIALVALLALGGGWMIYVTVRRRTSASGQRQSPNSGQWPRKPLLSRRPHRRRLPNVQQPNRPRQRPTRLQPSTRPRRRRLPNVRPVNGPKQHERQWPRRQQRNALRVKVLTRTA